MEELELEIFSILTEHEIRTLGDQKRVCHEIANLFPQHNLAKFALRGIVEQLESCGYECEAGPLENNTAFLALRELSDLVTETEEGERKGE